MTATPIGKEFADSVEEFGHKAVNTVTKWAEDNPDHFFDDALRLVGGGIKNTANVIGAIPGSKQALQLLDAGSYYGGKIGGKIAEAAGVDARIGGGIGNVVGDIALGFGLAKAGKAAKLGKMIQKGARAYSYTDLPGGPALLNYRQGRFLPSSMTIADQSAEAFYKGQQVVRDMAGGMQVDQFGSFAKPSLRNQIVMSMDDVTTTGWQHNIRVLTDEGAGANRIQDALYRPYQDLLEKQYQYIGLDELASNKDGWLDVLMDRADEIEGSIQKYKIKKAGKPKTVKRADVSPEEFKKASDAYKEWQKQLGLIQRTAYDKYTLNPLVDSRMVYSTDTQVKKVRKAISQTFLDIKGDHWHHIFGNKDAAEFMLAQVAQDPYISANLFHHLHRKKLYTSGISENMYLLKEKFHLDTKAKTGYHSWSKKMGLEGIGAKADLKLPDYARAMSESILKGDVDVNEIFYMMDFYAKLNKHQRNLLSKAYHGRKLSDLPNVSKIIHTEPTPDLLARKAVQLSKDLKGKKSMVGGK